MEINKIEGSYVNNLLIDNLFWIIIFPIFWLFQLPKSNFWMKYRKTGHVVSRLLQDGGRATIIARAGEVLVSQNG